MSALFCLLCSIHTILESLPVSSSGHLALLNRLYAKITKKQPLVISEEIEILLHIPTIFILLTFLTYHGVLSHIFSTKAFTLHTIATIFIANGLTTLAYLYKQKKNIRMPLWVGFLISACLLFSLYFAPVGTKKVILLTDAACIGLAQSMALLAPGLSRLAITLATGIWIGIAPPIALFFSLIISLFLIIPAVIKAFYEDKEKERKLLTFSGPQVGMLLLSSLVSYGCLEWLFHMVINNALPDFGWYLLIITAFSSLLS